MELIQKVATRQLAKHGMYRQNQILHANIAKMT